mgnify:CR=1 FL=1
MQSQKWTKTWESGTFYKVPLHRGRHDNTLCSGDMQKCNLILIMHFYANLGNHHVIVHKEFGLKRKSVIWVTACLALAADINTEGLYFVDKFALVFPFTFGLNRNLESIYAML